MRTHVFSCPSSCLFFNTCLALLCPETELKKTFIPGAPQAKIKKQSPVHVFFCRSGIQTKIALFIHSVMSVYGKIISEVIKIISNVHSLLACPGLGCYFWRLINNLTQPVGRTGWDDFFQPFTSFYLFRSSISLFEIVEFTLDVTISYSCCWFCYVSGVQLYNMFRIRAEISREVA